MKVAFLCLTYGRGGAGMHVSSLARTLSRMGHDVTVFHGGSTDTEGDDSRVTVVDLRVGMQRGFPTLWSYYFRRRLSQIAAQLSSFDVINGNPVVGDLAMMSTRIDVPYVATLHGSLRAMFRQLRIMKSLPDKPKTVDGLLSLLDSLTERREFLKAHAVVAVSQSVIGQYKEAFGTRHECFVVPPCLSWTPSEMNVKVDKSRGSTHKGFHEILFVGSNIPRKGVGFLLPTLSLVLRSESRVRLNIVTKTIQGSAKSQLTTLGLEEHVRHRPNLTRDELLDLYRSSDLLVFPSVYEGCPTVVMEAMALGVPTVAFDAPGTRDLIEDSRTGRLVPLGDVRNLANAIVELLQNDEERMRLGENARQDARLLLAPEVVAQSYLEIYRRVCGLP